jgi:SAM-dependent methyltransferase
MEEPHLDQEEEEENWNGLADFAEEENASQTTKEKQRYVKKIREPGWKQQRIERNREIVAKSKDRKKDLDGAWKDAYWAFCSKDSDKQIAPDETTESTWKLLETMDATREEAVRVREATVENLPSTMRDEYISKSAENWNKFYSSNQDKFFKDRNYLHHQFPELLPSTEKRVFYEYGCGAGNTIFPLMKTHPESFFFASDFAPNAIDLVQKNPEFSESRCKAFVCDLTSEELPNFISKDSVDFVLMVFVLSAIAPEKMLDVLRKLYTVVRPGGSVIFRDYGKYDLTQIRFLSKEQPFKLGDSMYARYDGTTSYFFSLEEITELFEKAGFVKDEVKYDVRELKNRKRKLVMFRVWISARFKKPGLGCLDSSSGSSSTSSVRAEKENAGSSSPTQG